MWNREVVSGEVASREVDSREVVSREVISREVISPEPECPIYDLRAPLIIISRRIYGGSEIFPLMERIACTFGWLLAGMSVMHDHHSFSWQENAAVWTIYFSA